MLSFKSPMPKYYTELDVKNMNIKNTKEIIEKIKNIFPKPSCQRKDGCIYSAALEYVCKECIKWETSQKIIEIIGGKNNE
jgi:hypothetical protein